MKKIAYTVLLIVLFQITHISSIKGQAYADVPIGVTYNDQFGCFQFSDSEVLNDYVQILDDVFNAIYFEEDLEQIYLDIENHFGHSSLMMKIKNQEAQFFEDEIWTEENDPDRHFIQDKMLRLLLNEHAELILGDELITLVDLCQYIKIDFSRPKLVNLKRQFVAGENNSTQPNAVLPQGILQDLPSGIKVENYCEERRREADDESNKVNDTCCDKRDITKDMFYQYSDNRKMRATFYQVNISFLRRIGCVTRNYKKNFLGIWLPSKADVINVNMNGQVYEGSGPNQPCAVEVPVDLGRQRDNRREVSREVWFGNTFWTRQGSMESTHYVQDGGASGEVVLCLSDIEIENACYGCEVTVGDGQGPPPPPEQYISGPTNLCQGESDTYSILNYVNSGDPAVDWSSSSNVVLLPTANNSQIVVEAIDGMESGLATIAADYTNHSITFQIWIGAPNIGYLTITPEPEPVQLVEIEVVGLFNTLELQDLTLIDWEEISSTNANFTAPDGYHFAYALGYGTFWEVSGSVLIGNACGTDYEEFYITPPPIMQQVIFDGRIISVVDVKDDNWNTGRKANDPVPDHMVQNIKVYDMVGKLIVNSKSTSTLDISEIQKGMYLVNSVLSNGEELTKHIVK